MGKQDLFFQCRILPHLLWIVRLLHPGWFRSRTPKAEVRLGYVEKG